MWQVTDVNPRPPNFVTLPKLQLKRIRRRGIAFPKPSQTMASPTPALGVRTSTVFDKKKLQKKSPPGSPGKDNSSYAGRKYVLSPNFASLEFMSTRIWLIESGGLIGPL